MVPIDPSMADLADLLPFADAANLSERFTRLEARLRKAPVQGPGSELFKLAADALETLPPEPCTRERAICWLLIGRQRFVSSQPFSALDAVIHGVGVAEGVGDDGVLAKSLKMLGAFYSETGNFPAATAALTRALTAARSAGSAWDEVEIFMNLGIAHQYTGQFSIAIPCFERAIEIGASADIPRVARASPLSNTALACLYLRDIPRGLTAAEQAIQILDQPETEDERFARAVTEFYYTRLLLETRNVPMAAARAKLAKSFASSTGERAEMFAEMALGLAEAYEPATRDIGLSRLQRVINECRRGVHIVLRDALSTIVRAYEAAGQPNNALVFQREVLQLNRDSRVKNLLEHHHRHIVQVKKSLDGRAEAALDVEKTALQFQRFEIDTFSEFTQVLEENTVTVEFHDDDTGEHCYRVGAMARELARKFGLDDDACRLVDLSARLHDVGKIRIPDSILLKPGRFTPEERAIMEQHCEFGREIISEAGLGQLFIAQEIAFNHHERWDGTGYPRKIAGEMIPLVARITSIVDVFDALAHRRPYKEAWPLQDAIREIARNSGTQFDPKLTELFLELVPELQAKYGDLDTYLSAESRKNELIINRAKLARELKTNSDSLDVRR